MWKHVKNTRGNRYQWSESPVQESREPSSVTVGEPDLTNASCRGVVLAKVTGANWQLTVVFQRLNGSVEHLWVQCINGYCNCIDCCEKIVTATFFYCQCCWLECELYSPARVFLQSFFLVDCHLVYWLYRRLLGVCTSHLVSSSSRTSPQYLQFSNHLCDTLEFSRPCCNYL